MLATTRSEKRIEWPLFAAAFVGREAAPVVVAGGVALVAEGVPLLLVTAPATCFTLSAKATLKDALFPLNFAAKMLL